MAPRAAGFAGRNAAVVEGRQRIPCAAVVERGRLCCCCNAMAPRAAGSADRKAAVAEGRSIACDEIAVIAREIAVVGSLEICFGVRFDRTQPRKGGFYERFTCISL